MSVSRPNFVDSPYFVMEDENWHLKEGAPEDVQKEFDEFMQEQEKRNAEGIFL